MPVALIRITNHFLQYNSSLVDGNLSIRIAIAEEFLKKFEKSARSQ